MSGIFNQPSSDINANKGPLMIKVCVTMMFVSIIGLCGRFLARRLVKQPLLWDDWIIVAGLLFSWACCVTQIIGRFLHVVFEMICLISHGYNQGLRLPDLAGMRSSQRQRPRRIISSSYTLSTFSIHLPLLPSNSRSFCSIVAYSLCHRPRSLFWRLAFLLEHGAWRW